MTKVVLPRTNQTGANEWGDVEANDVAIREVVNGELDNENLKSAAGITRGKLAADAKGIVGTWYTPKVIATEQSRESTSFGTLTTADEIKEVVLPENGLLVIGYAALAKCSVSAAGRAAIFIGSNQLKIAGATVPVVQETELFGTGFQTISSVARGLDRGEGTSYVTTGQAVYAAKTEHTGGMCFVHAAAGTYNISVQYRATSGSVTAKERKLWVANLG